MIIEENYPLVWHIIYKLQRKGAPGLDITVEEESPAAGGR